MKARMIYIVAALLLTALAGLATASGRSSARSMAMGGAHIGLASGVDAAKYNPANLGLSNHRQTGLELFALGANISNNSFSLADYNKYSGAILTSADKTYILDRIPAEGMKLTADVEADALAISTGSIALCVTGVGSANVNLSRDIFDLILNGNAYADTIDVTGSYSDVLSYASAGLSYGTSIYTQGSRQLAVGFTAKYLRGIAIERVTELHGMIATYQTGFQGEGNMIAQTAEGGTGYAVDLGAALKLSNSYTVGLQIENFLSQIKWNRRTQEHGYVFSFDTMTVANMGDDYIVSDDYTKDIAPFTSTLPSTMTFGIARTSGSLVWAVDWQQGFKKSVGSTTKPRISAGAEWSGLKFIPLRAGYATGGKYNTAFSFGSGLRLFGYYLDVAAVTGSSLSGYSSKGLNIAVSTGLHF
jgi:hypothetical protein